MRTNYNVLLLSLAVLMALAPAASAQQVPGPDTTVEPEKRGQTGMKFLTVAIDPRAAAMGGAVTAEQFGTSSALMYNPASMARLESTGHANLGIAQYITDINYNAATVAFKPGGGNYGVIGLSIMNVDYGEFNGTVRANTTEGFVETGTYQPTALAVGLGYARALTDRFSVGGHVKYVTQDLGSHAVTRVESGGQPLGDGTQASFEDYSVGTAAVDFGVLYNTGFRSLTIAMSIRNFSPELTYARDPFELPLTFQIGASMNLVELTNMDPNAHALRIGVDAERPRDFVEHLRIGGEYTFMNIVSLRAGMGQAFVGEDSEEGVSVGAGLRYSISNFGLGVDYAYTNFGIFEDVNRFAVQVSF